MIPTNDAIKCVLEQYIDPLVASLVLVTFSVGEAVGEDDLVGAGVKLGTDVGREDTVGAAVGGAVGEAEGSSSMRFTPKLIDEAEAVLPKLIQLNFEVPTV